MDNLEFYPDPNSKLPLYKQLYNHIKDGIISGKITGGERLPSRRKLAQKLNISTNTVLGAYQLLESEGYIVPKASSGFYVNPDYNLFQDSVHLDWETQSDAKYIFSQNGLELSKIPKKSLARIYRNAIYDQPDLFSHGEKPGDPCLRQAVAKYLYAVRGIKCDENQIIIGAGIDYILTCLCRVLGKDTIWGLENPCYRRSFSSIQDSVSETRLLNIGFDGFDVKNLLNSDIDVLYFMPTHQFPVGQIISEDRRREILDWAKMGNHYIVEDDYDGSFIYQKNAPRSLFTMDDSERVILMGDFSRSLAPGIKIAYLVMPKPLIEKWSLKLPFYNCLASRAEQFAVAELIKDGHAIKYVNSLRKIYKEKQDILISALNNLPFANRLTIHGDNGGTHLLVTFKTEKTEQELKKSAYKAGVKIMPLSAFLFKQSDKLPDKTFIFGYGGLTNNEIEEGIAALSHLLD